MSHSNLEANYCYAKNDSFNFIKLIMEIKKKKKILLMLLFLFLYLLEVRICEDQMFLNLLMTHRPI